MSIENPIWGAPRIHGELLKLGLDVAQSSVAKSMAKRREPPSQGWRTFLRNHAPDIKDREWLPLYKLGWRTHLRPRLNFRLDGTHPLSGSHHQKVVVVDDTVAFVGGLDLTHGRWDTPAHRRDEPFCMDVRGRQARPNHDVQAIVDGAAARALGELCRDRWQRATDQRTSTVDAAPDNDP